MSDKHPPDETHRVGDVEAAGWIDEKTGDIRWKITRKYLKNGRQQSSAYLLGSQLGDLQQLIEEIDDDIAEID